MPMYSMKCTHCPHEEAILCPVDQRDAQVCKKCGSLLKNMPSAVSFKINGDKWSPNRT